MKYLMLLCFLCSYLLPILAVGEEDSPYPLYHAQINPKDKASLQRGAKYFMNYCSGCHSLKYMRYNQVARGIGLVNAQGEVLKKLYEQNLIFTGARIGDSIKIAMRLKQGERWFGVAPLDLTLEARVRGIDWIYTYLLTFYKDDSRPWGANNLVYKDVAMPNVLLNLQGSQKPVYRDVVLNLTGDFKPVKVVDHLEMISPGTISSGEFDQVVTDLVNFLSYVAVPEKALRYKIGLWVLLFLVIFLIICYLLKKEYWKDIH